MSNDKALETRQDGPVANLRRFLETRQKQLAEYLGSRFKPEVMIRLTLREFAADTKSGQMLRQCSPESIYSALIDAAQLGLEPGGVRGLAYLVPFKGRCQLVPGYRGLIRLALQSREVKSLYAHVAYGNDTLHVELGSQPRVDHQPALDGERGEIRGAYAVAHLASGAVDVEWMSLYELEEVRARAAKGRGGHDGFYSDNLAEMYRKAPIKKLSKRLPLGDDFYRALEADDAEMGSRPRVIDVDDAVVVEQSSYDKARSRVAQARAEIVQPQEDPHGDPEPS